VEKNHLCSVEQGALWHCPIILEVAVGFSLEKTWFEYDWCVANKVINGKQATIAWYVDDVKISHVDVAVNNEIIEKIRNEFGKHMDTTFKYSPIHDYLGVTIDFSQKGQVQLAMSK
jgi:hypothetical protein